MPNNCYIQAVDNDTEEYEFVYLTDDNDENLSIIKNQVARGNYYYILQDNWSVENDDKLLFTGKNVIIDLNGFTLSCPTQKVTINTTSIQILDSSTENTGVIECYILEVYPVSFVIKGGTIISYTDIAVQIDRNTPGPITVTMSGGKIVGQMKMMISADKPIDFYFSGGEITKGITYQLIDVDDVSNCRLTFAPWVTVVCDEDGWPTSLVELFDYAVSKSALVVGVYNYELAWGWELTGGELGDLVIPAGEVYYLWGRNAVSAEYEYLNIVYHDGAWGKAAA